MVNGVTQLDIFPWASGSYGDVYVGDLGGQKIAIKRMRVYQRNSLDEGDKLDKVWVDTCRSLLHSSLVLTFPF